MRTGAPAAPAQGAAPCPAALLDDWVLRDNHVPLITHNPGGELRTMTLLLFQHLAHTSQSYAHTKDSLAFNEERHVASDVPSHA